MTSHINPLITAPNPCFDKDGDYSAPIPIKKSKQDIWYPEGEEMVVKFSADEDPPEISQTAINTLVPEPIMELYKKYGGSGTDPYVVITVFSHKVTDDNQLMKWILFRKHRTDPVYGAGEVVEFELEKHKSLVENTISEEMMAKDVFVKLVIWDYDKLSANDIIGMRTVNIANFFRKSRMLQQDGEEEIKQMDEKQARLAVWTRFKVPIKQGPTVDDLHIADLEIQIEYAPNEENKDEDGTFKLYILNAKFTSDFCLPPKDTFPYQFVGALTVLVLYLATGLMYFSLVEGWGTSQTIYFAFVVLTTIGYGDHPSPTQLPETYYFLSFYIIFALVAFSFAMSSIIGFITDSIESGTGELMTIGADGDDDEEDIAEALALKALLDMDGIKKDKLYYCKTIFGALKSVPLIVYGFILFTVGSALFIDQTGWFIKSSDGSKVSGFIEVFYYLVVTMTTVGFGDMYPDPEAGKKATLAIIFFLVMLISLVSPLASAISGPIVAKAERIRKKKIFEDAFKTPKDFVAFDEDGDDDISKFEFLKTMLVKLQVAKPEQIEEIVAQFRSIDVDMSGSLKKQEIQDWYREKQRNAQS